MFMKIQTVDLHLLLTILHSHVLSYEFNDLQVSLGFLHFIMWPTVQTCDRVEEIHVRVLLLSIVSFDRSFQQVRDILSHESVSVLRSNLNRLYRIKARLCFRPQFNVWICILILYMKRCILFIIWFARPLGFRIKYRCNHKKYAVPAIWVRLF